jgi:membrane protease YdiL (CAAX protease family)
VTRKGTGPAFWTVVFVLLRAAQMRGFRRLTKLNRRRARGGTLVFAMFCLVAAVTHIRTAIDVGTAVPEAERVQAEAKGRVVVEEWFAGRIENYEAEAAKSPAKRDQIIHEENSEIALEAKRLAQTDRGDAKAIEARLLTTVRDNPKALLSKNSLWWQPGKLPDIIALFAILWWSLMLVCQGEGPEVNTLRHQNPIWEWLFSHPAPPGAIFLAEMISPIAANPMFLAAPLFPALVFGGVYGFLGGITAFLLVGVPTTVGLACLGKAIQIRILLRLSPRARGAVLGFMSGFGFISILPIYLISPSSVHAIVAGVGGWLLRLSDLPWPPARMLVGYSSTGDYVLWRGIVICWSLAMVLILGSVAFAVASARRGLVGPSGLVVRVAKPVQFGREPLYRKELLWLRRDRGVLVQAVLMPLALAALQVVNLRGLIDYGANTWSALCGVAVLFGTYFLLTLGPRSLASEGPALWIALTWPRDLETLLKAKAKLWAAVASTFVGAALVYCAAHYPADVGSILVVGLLWWAFARSLAEKTVTLTTIVSPSGDPERPPAALRWAAMLGTLTFTVGIFTRQWSLIAAGVVYSILTATAMWQYFRLRLPYLYDPWSVQLPPPPTLLHAMVAISATVEAVALMSAVGLGAFGRGHIAAINAALYGACAFAATIIVSRFLAKRGVRQRDIWFWRDGKRGRPYIDLGSEWLPVVLAIATAAALGIALGAAAHLYLFVLHQFPDAARTLAKDGDILPNTRAAYFVMAVVFAPFAEEFLFRGLLYRALDREWGGWRAVIGAAAFFAIYHPPLSWPPVLVLGAMNAMIYKRTGLLAPAVVAHMTYNAVVVAF